MTQLQVGPIRIKNVVEMELETSLRFLFPWMTPEHLTPHLDWIAPQYFSPATKKMVLSIQTYILQTPVHTILVDTCVGNGKKRENPEWNLRNGDFLERLAQAGVRPEAVDYVLCTHLHTDHVGWNTRLENGRWVPAFPNARYLCSQEEYAYWEAEAEGEQAETFADSVLPVVQAGLWHQVPGGYDLGEGISLLPTPGHTPGHCSVRMVTPGGNAVITGDMIHHPVQVAHPEWHSQFCVDPAQNEQTRRTCFAAWAGDETTVLGTHFPAPSHGRLVPDGPAWRFQPVKALSEM